MIDLETLLQPVADEAPCGRDCEYDPVFGELERAAAGRAEQRMGDEIIPAEPPDWPTVTDHAQALFTETRDLRVGILLARAAMHSEGLPALADGLTLVRRLTEDFWDSIYPQLDAEDDDDPTLRVNSLLALNDREGFVGDVLALPVVAERQLGRFSLRDVKLANGDLDPAGDEDRPDAALINGAFIGAELDELQASADAVTRAAEEFAALKALLDDKVGAAGPDLSLLAGELKALQGLFADKLDSRGVAVDAPEGGVAEDGAATISAPSGEIRSRDDVIRNLDRICAYFQEHEPSSPVPLLLERAKRLVSMSFVEILEDMTPSGVAEAKIVGGIVDSDY
ncbi:MAG: type VI secretion system protein TssA [Pseudomonadota bacterium]